MTASAMMMQAYLLQQQRASVSAALGFPSYFGLSPLFNSFLPTSSLLGGLPRSPLLGNSRMPLSNSFTALPAENKSHRLVFVVFYFKKIMDYAYR